MSAVPRPSHAMHRDPRLIAIGGALAVAACVVALCAPILQRSPWADEAMLFSNYPLASVWQAVQPLPYYDQAATPAYSAAVSLVAQHDVAIVRAVSLGAISLAIAAALIVPNATWLAALVALLCLAAFLEPLVLYSEFKHYGLEAAGVALTTLWFEYKDSRAPFRRRDVLLLVFGMSLGISTLITTGVALGVFFAVKYWQRQTVKAGELGLGLVVIAAAVAYYLLIRHITQVQMANYTDAYSHAVGLDNVVALIAAVQGVVGRQGLALTGLALIAIVLTGSDVRSRRLLLIAGVTAAAFLAVSFVGLYPATNSRHLNWTAAVFVALLFAGIHRGVSARGAARIAGAVLAVAVLGAGVRTGLHLWTDSFEVTQNREAMAYLEAQPPTAVGLWVAGQPVVDYYARLLPDLRKHAFFGAVNRESAVVPPLELHRTLSGAQFAAVKDQPGAWGRTLMLRVAMDFSVPAAALIAAAPRGVPFLVLASHYDLQARGGYPQARVDGLKTALSAAHCDYRIVEGLRRVAIYRVICPQ